MSRHKILLVEEDITVTYPGEQKPALYGVSLRVCDGESIAIIGPSGAGKSTLLNTLYDSSDEASMIHQEYLLVPQLSLFHNVYMGKLDMYHSLYNILNLCLPQKRVHKEIYRITRELDIHELIGKKCRELSGGEQQRTAVARALFRSAEICFADEPVSAMDTENARRTLRLLTKATTVVASMHNTDLALDYFDRIIGLRKGEIQFDLPTDLVTSTAIEALYRQ